MYLQKWRLRLRNYLENRRLKHYIRRLSIAERDVILDQSPIAAYWFQGTGFHVFLKNEPDFSKAHVDDLGEISTQAAEDWIIRQYLLSSHEQTN